ncbi:carbohydrate ABC transporter permease [Cohnella endophytica]|uniref:Carbohydrate ABC transporter permease n=1 Tax=Cohnella endophytica TaxID=2419778 RepID=A0A494XX11_9BACL|nr:carbohydrate ABC transporter permease [Cohnella endophytica]RKP55125.1 carbohydrate ABC transporter permease [Cohnella endophytica]
MPRTLRKSLPHIVLMAYVVIILFPFVFVVFSSLKESNVEISQAPFALPKSLYFENYAKAWTQAKIDKYFVNSAYIGVSSAVIGVLIAAGTSFALTRMKFRNSSKIVYQTILFSMLIPANGLFIAQYFLVSDLHIIGTHWALFWPYTAGALPFSVLLISAFMKSLPNELEEAAIIDGLSAVGLFARIVLPLTLPALVTVFIINFLGNWNEYLLANFFISKDALRTLPTGMVGFRDAYQMNYALVSTGIVFSVLPVLILYAFLQKQIIEGITAGSVKG